MDLWQNKCHQDISHIQTILHFYKINFLSLGWNIWTMCLLLCCGNVMSLFLSFSVSLLVRCLILLLWKLLWGKKDLAALLPHKYFSMSQVFVLQVNWNHIGNLFSYAYTWPRSLFLQQKLTYVPQMFDNPLSWYILRDYGDNLLWNGQY